MTVLILLTWFVTFLNKFALGDEGNVRIRIHVPEYINHHVHTRTVYLYLHEPVHPPHHEKETYHESDQWSSWRSYQQSSNGIDDSRAKGEVSNFEDDDFKRKKPKFPTEKIRPLLSPPRNTYDYHYEPTRDTSSEDGYANNDILSDPGNSHTKGGYEIYEDLTEDEPEDVTYKQIFHESGYRKGSESESDRTLNKDTKDFYDSEHEQADFFKTGFHEESRAKQLNSGKRVNVSKESSKNLQKRQPTDPYGEFGKRLYFITART